MVDPAVIEEVKRRTNIATVIGRYTTLKRAGKNLVGLCPFHQEKSPSFSVNEAKGFFYCFGCQANGDVIGFLTRMRGLSFFEALEDLAREAGIVLPQTAANPDYAKERDRRRSLVRVNALVAEFYHRVLLQSSLAEGARAYLAGRGVEQAACAEFHIGYAPDDWSTLSDFLHKKGVDMAMAEELGLVKRRDGAREHYDLFRHRVMFPIVDPRGEVVGFGGRALGADEKAKYINSPESVLFKKGRTLYGLPQAIPSAGRDEHLIFVEGYVDLIALWQAGIKNVVAPLGTALTREHLELAQRYASAVLFLFDGDSAGEAAAHRAVDMVLEVGVPARMVHLPGGRDPDDFVRQSGAAAMRTLLGEAKPLVGYFLDRAWAATPKDAPGVAAWVRDALDTIAKLRDPFERGLYLKTIAERSSFSEANLRKQIAGKLVGRSASEPGPTVQLARFPNEEAMVVKLMLHYPRLRRAFGDIQVVEKFSDPLLRRAAAILIEGDSVDGVKEEPDTLYADEELATLIRRLEQEGLDETPEHLADQMLLDAMSLIYIRHLGDQMRLKKVELQQLGSDAEKLAASSEVARLKLLRERLLRERTLESLSSVH